MMKSRESLVALLRQFTVNEHALVHEEREPMPPMGVIALGLPVKLPGRLS